MEIGFVARGKNRERRNVFAAFCRSLIFLLMIVTTILTETIRIYSTPNIWRSGIVTATQIANYIADTLNVLLFGISSHPFVKSSIGARFCHC
jgi:hypothetical protein